MIKQMADQPKQTLLEAHTWAGRLETVVELIAPRFARTEPRTRVAAFLSGLLSPIERKNGWQLAEEAGDQKPYGIQHLLGRAKWSADEVRDDLRSYVVEHLSDEEAVAVRRSRPAF